MDKTKKGLLFCISAPSGGGKTTISEHLLMRNISGLSRCITYTSRIPRAGEIEGESYHFISRNEFEQDIAAGLFFESQEVHGNLYGIRLTSLEEGILSGKDLILVIDIKGSFEVKKRFPDSAILIVVVPPERSILESRMKNRGTDSPDVIRKRLETANLEYSLYFNHKSVIDYIVINDILNEAVDNVSCIISAERLKIKRFHEDDFTRLFR
jgi:guanylate kinase